MGSADRRINQGIRRGERLIRELGDELREARLAAGLSQDAVARAAGLWQQDLSRIERGSDLGLRILVAAKLAATLGRELSLRTYEIGPPLRDKAHVALLQRLRDQLASSFRWATEVPMPIAGDRRALDAVITGAGVRIGVEAETRVRDIQALLREVELKRRDASLDRMILLLRASRANRAIDAGAQALLAVAFPLRTRTVLAALRHGRDPGGDGIVLL